MSYLALAGNMLLGNMEPRSLSPAYTQYNLFLMDAGVGGQSELQTKRNGFCWQLLCFLQP